MNRYHIVGGTIVDGTGSAGCSGSLLIEGDRILAVGAVENPGDAQRIDATGHTVCPGFFDAHNHSDGWLLLKKNLEPKTLQGFTTELLMSDGISYAPVNELTAPHWIQYLRSLNGLRHEHYTGWKSLEDYGSCLNGRSAQNSVLQIPYANVRSLVAGFGSRPLDDFQRQQIRMQIELGMEQGATGLSTGMDYISQCFATKNELVDACKAMAPYNGIYVTHIRYKDDLLPAMKEAIEIGREANVGVHISHLKPMADGHYEALCELLERGGREVSLTFDIYPYQAGSTMLNFLLPYELWEDGPFTAASGLLRPEIREQLTRVLESRDMRDEVLRIAWVASKENSQHIGKTLTEYASDIGKTVTDAACNLLIEENLAALMVFEDDRENLHHPLINHPKGMMGTDGIYFPDGKVHPRMYGSVGRWLGPYVRDLKLFTFEEAVAKLSSVGCRRFGIEKRGELREGYFADVVILDPSAIDDPATTGNPLSTCPGIRDVMTNGQWVVRDSSAIEEFDVAPGRYLRCTR